MIKIEITANVNVHIHQHEVSQEDIAILAGILARVKALAQKAKALAAKY